MKFRSYYKVLLILYCCLPLVSWAQYTGGIADGNSTSITIINNCAALDDNLLFFGGNSNLNSSTSVVQNSCATLDDNLLFFGGNGAGSSTSLVTQTNCTALDDNLLFYGGNGGGSTTAVAIQTVCSPLDDNLLFFGGNADGSSTASLTQVNCPTKDDYALFYGGSGDGYAKSAKDSCTPYTPPAPIAYFTANDTTICNGDSVFFTDASLNNPSTWKWLFPGATPSSSTLPNPHVTYTTVGIHSVTLIVSNILGTDTLIKTMYISVSAIPSKTITTNKATTICGGDSILLTAVTATNYLWSTGATTQSISVKNTGNYFCNLSNTGGCNTQSDSIFVTVNQPVDSVLLNSNSAICEGDTVKINTTIYGGNSSNLVYQWSGPNNFNSTVSSIQLVNATTTNSGTYQLTLKNTGCTDKIVSIAYTVNTKPAQPLITSNSPLCAGDTLKLSISNVNGLNTYNWTGPNSFTSNATTTTLPSVSINNAGTYSVYTTHTNGCKSVLTTTTATINLTVTPTASISSSALHDSICKGLPVTFTSVVTNEGTSPVYNWYKNNVLVSNTINYVTNSIVANDNIQLKLHSSAQCAVPSDVLSNLVLMQVHPSLDSLFTTNNSPICEGDTIVIQTTLIGSAPPNITFYWQGPNNFNSVYKDVTIPNATSVMDSIYTLTVYQPGCPTISRNVNVDVNQPPSRPVITANGNTLTSSAITGNVWYMNGIAMGLTTQIITPTQDGVYTVVQVNNGCSSIASSPYNYITTTIKELAHNISIYPNPTKNNWTIEIENSGSALIYNTLGEVVKMQHFFAGKNNVDATHFSSGVYLLVVSNNNTQQNLVRTRLIKE